MGRSTKRRYEEHTLAARGEGHPFPARGPLEPETKQMTNVGSRFRGQALVLRADGSGIATTEEQAEQSGVMLLSVPLARKRGKLFSI